MAAGFGADEGNQVAGVLKVAAQPVAAGQIAAQGDDALDACRAVVGQQAADGFARLPYARQVRRSGHAFGQDFAHRRQRAVLRGAARAEGDGAEPGLQRIQARARGAQLFSAFGGFGREEFKAQGVFHGVLRSSFVKGFVKSQGPEGAWRVA